MGPYLNVLDSASSNLTTISLIMDTVTPISSEYPGIFPYLHIKTVKHKCLDGKMTNSNDKTVLSCIISRFEALRLV